MTPEEREVWNRSYYARNRERLKAEALQRYHTKRKYEIDPVKQSAYYKAWRLANPEKAKRTPEQDARADARFKYRYANDPIFRRRFLDRQKSYAKSNPKMVRKINLKRKYGLTLEKFEAMLVAQDNKCAICKKGRTRDYRSFPNVDHCHKTKKVRGLLCQKCNRGLGLFNDDVQRLLAAVAYLQGA